MNIMVIGAYGKVGRLVVEQALKRGHKVTGIARHKHEDFDFENIVVKDMYDMVKEDVAGMDAVVDAVSAWTPATVAVHYHGLLHVLFLLKNSVTRYIKVGGSNTLFIDKNRTRILQQLPLYYPKYMQNLCDAHRLGLETLRKFSDVRWTYVTPAYKFAPLGPYTGHYHIDGEVFVPAKKDDPANGHNDYISYADYSKGLIDIIENGTYIRQRITLVNGDIPDANLIW